MIARSCSRCSRPIANRWRAICRTTSSEGRSGACSYPGSRVATFSILRTTADVDERAVRPRPARRRVATSGSRPGEGPGGQKRRHVSPFRVDFLSHRDREIHPHVAAAGSACHKARGMRRLMGCIALTALGCAGSHPALPVDPGVTFSAHREADVLVVDRLPGGGTGIVTSPSRLGTQGAPDRVLRVGDETRAGLWIIGRSRVLVRDAPSTIAPRAGEVLSTWEGTAMRLTLYARVGGGLRSDVFARTDSAPAPVTLSREQLPHGSYRAEVRDEHGASVGWLRVQVRPSERVSRVYDAALPGQVDGAVAGAGALVLDADIGR